MLQLVADIYNVVSCACVVLVSSKNKSENVLTRRLVRAQDRLCDAESVGLDTRLTPPRLLVSPAGTVSGQQSLETLGHDAASICGHAPLSHWKISRLLGP